LKIVFCGAEIVLIWASVEWQRLLIVAIGRNDARGRRIGVRTAIKVVETAIPDPISPHGTGSAHLRPA